MKLVYDAIIHVDIPTMYVWEQKNYISMHIPLICFKVFQTNMVIFFTPNKKYTYSFISENKKMIAILFSLRCFLSLLSTSWMRTLQQKSKRLIRIYLPNLCVVVPCPRRMVPVRRTYLFPCNSQNCVEASSV